MGEKKILRTVKFCALKIKNYGAKMSLFEDFVYKDGEIVDNSWVKWFHFGIPDEEVRQIRAENKYSNYCNQ